MNERHHVDPTHDPALRSWVDSANPPESDFPVQNLPLGMFQREGGEDPRPGVAIGDRIVDLAALLHDGLLKGPAGEAVAAVDGAGLNGLLAQGRPAWSALRQRLSWLLREGESELAGDPTRVSRALLAAEDAKMLLPAEVGDYTDFYASVHHATNVGSMFRPDNPLLPNYKWLPVAYHGRASSLRPSGVDVRRPWGQTRPDDSAPPALGPTKLLDYELEVGLWVGPGNELGVPVALDEAEGHLLGISLVNDWSARDIQKWEYQPLGPFLAKSFATTVSPWVITFDALAPFRAPAFAREDGDPPPLPHLASPANQSAGGIDAVLEVHLLSAQMREQGLPPLRLSRGNLRDMYWTPAQMVTHHTSNGCNLRPGDLLATGTVSGAEPDSRGSLLELTWRGTQPLELPTQEKRRFLHDGDEVILRGHCHRQGARRIGLGECRARVLPAV